LAGGASSPALSRRAHKTAKWELSADWHAAAAIAYEPARAEAFNNLLSIALQRDPHAAAAASMELADDSMRTEVIGQLARRWASLDAEAASRWLQFLQPGSARTAAIIGAGPVLAEAQPQTVLELACELAEGPEKNELVQRTASAWLQTDPAAALEWLNGAEDAAVKRIVIRQHVNNLLASEDPASAAAWLERIPEAIEHNAFVSRVSESWGRVESQAAWRWGISLAEGEARSIAIQSILASWAAQNPVEAGTAAIQHLPPQEQSQGVLAVLLSWVQTDPAAAASWVSLFPESALRETATQNIIGNWALQDIESARQWLEALPAGASRDAGILTWHSMSFLQQN
jgi:hypothetical protein